MEIRRWKYHLLDKPMSIAPLVTFRVVFGALMFISVVRFWMNGWIDMQFVQPAFHFKYFGFHWIPDLPEIGYYALFATMALSALGIALGFVYRWSAVLFFLSFTFIELSDATYYLNHYYFVSIVSGLLIFLPANKAHALDVRLGLVSGQRQVGAWSVNLIKFQLGLVYFLAGVAKLNSEWLVEAMPLAIWLPAQDHLPIIGAIMPFKSTAYAFSWAGVIYDLAIPFLLLLSRTRWLAYLAVIGFHVMTWAMFQIGMFPFIMIGATLVFFSPSFHARIHRLFGWKLHHLSMNTSQRIPRWASASLVAFVVVQLAVPFRYLLYPGNLFWNEEGYRFGWRVMLMEKAGYAQFKVIDAQGRTTWVDNQEFLTPVQEKMMATQPDFMLQYAEYLKAFYASEGVDKPRVSADVFVALNGRSSQRFIDASIDLAALEDGWGHKDWILPLKQDRI